MSLFRNWIGSSHPKGLTKLEYWSKWELNELIDDAQRAYQLISDCALLDDDPHIEFFKESLELELFDLTHDNVPDFSNVWQWFRPEGEWSQLTNHKNEELREQIYYRSNRWKTEAQED